MYETHGGICWSQNRMAKNLKELSQLQGNDTEYGCNNDLSMAPTPFAAHPDTPLPISPFVAPLDIKFPG